MQGINVSEICRTVMNFFDSTVEKADKKVGFVKRKSKLTSKLFVKTLVLSCFADREVSLERICLMLKQSDLKISKQGLHQRFNDESVALLQTLFQESLVQFRTEKSTVIELLQPFSSIRITDSTGISLPSHLKLRYKGYGGASSEAGLKLQTTLDYLEGQIKEIKVTEGCRSDQGFDEHLNGVQRGALYLQDQGYFKLSSFAKINGSGGYFISRYLYSTHLFDENAHQINLQEELKKAGDLFEKTVWIGQKEKIKVRIIATRFSGDEVDKRIRKIKRNNQKRGTLPSQGILKMAEWSIYITNIDESLLHHGQVHLIYSLRWQIELFFKLCKSESGIDKVSGRNTNRILCELYAKLICVVKLLYFCFPIRWQADQNEISFRKAYHALRLRGVEFLHSLKSRYRLMKFLKFFFEDLIEFAIKDKKRNKRRTTYQKIMDSTQQKVFA